MKSPSINMVEDSELLFFDTFSHESCEELNLDLVQFPRPVMITEIRIIPLGARVQADFPGGYRLGATNPSTFQLEFFVNDLSKRNNYTFERLGSIEYRQNIDIQFLVTSKILTDGLVLTGLYSAVTLAIYGTLTKLSSKERSSPQPSSGPQQAPRPQDHRQILDCSVSADWDRHSRPLDSVPEPPQPIHPRSQTIVEGPRFAEVPPIIHPQPEAHVQYAAEIPSVYPDPPPPVVYQECIPASVPSVPPPTPYPPYESRYAKPWPPPEEHYQAPEEGYNQPVYNRPPDSSSYPPPPPPATLPHSLWERKECHPPPPSEIARSEHDPYDHKLHSREKDRDRRDKPWDRDNHPPEDSSRDRDYKRRERDHRSWERGSPERYRDRDRIKDMSNRERERDRERNRDLGRDKPRSHESYGDRGSRIPPKRPVTPPTPPPSIRSRTPQTPPEMDKPIGGPRTPKEEEPVESFEEQETSRSHSNPYYDVSSVPRAEDPLYNLSEGEIQEGDNTEDDDGYEEIVSEEEIMSDGEDRVLDMAEMEYDLADESWNYMSSFIPYHCELIPCQHFKDPTLSCFELMKNANKKGSVLGDEKKLKENKILDMVNLYGGTKHNERWVEDLESLNSEIIAECLLSIDSKEVYEDAVKTLVNWTVEGLNYEMALQQPQTAYKIRHLKAGIRLASLLFQTNSEIIDKLLAHEVPKHLLQLFDQPHMTLPLKLLILRALDAVTFTKAGFEFLLNKTLDFPPPTQFDFCSSLDENLKCVTYKTGYQKLLELMLSKQLTRAMVSISALMQKIHLYEVLQKFKESVENIVLNTQSSEVKPAAEEACPDSESPALQTENEADVVPEMAINPVSWEPHLQILITCLNEITTKIKTAWTTLAHQKRYLPATSCFEVQKSPFDPYPGLLRALKESHLLESISSLLSCPLLIISHPAIISSVRDFFMELLHSQYGMLYLLSSCDVINSIQKSLLQNLDEGRDESNEDNLAQNLGMQIVYRLQALLYVDCLLAYHARGGPKRDLDDSDAVSALHYMYTMIFSPIGRPAVVDVLATGDNMNCLLPFVQMTGEEELDIKLSKSEHAGYVTELLMMTIYFTENVSIYEKFSESFFELSQQDLTPKLHDLGLWMSPARKISNYTHEAVPYLTGVLKAHLEDVASLPPELITSVRILKHICLPPPGEENQELKYMYATIQLFSNDGLSYFVTILQTVCDVFLKPSHQSVALVGLQGILLVSLIKPIISLMKTVLAYLISCRKTEFKDLTAVQVFLQTYSLMLIIPPTSFSFHQAQQVQNEIIESLLTYTQPYLGPEESDEALSKSLWTLMLQEVFKYAQQSPRTFITGLTVLSELLPLPLPLQTREALNSEEINKTVNHRKLWSAHLHSLSGKIQEIVLSLAASSCQPLQQLLRRVCIQLADLAVPTSLVIVRATLDALLESLDLEHKEAIEPPPPNSTSTSSTLQHVSQDPPLPKPCSSSTARILNLISYLVSHFAFKIPMMHILRASSKADEKYVDVLTNLLNVLNLPCEKPSHVQSQESIVSIIQSLCDPDIGFITMENGASVNEVLSSCLPVKEHMLSICGALIQHISHHRHNYASVLPAMRTLIMLTEHDYGFYHVKLALEQYPDALHSLFTRLSSSFSKDSSDCLTTLSATLEFLRLMVNGYEEGEQTGRSMLLSPSQLAILLKHQPQGGKTKQDKENNKSIPFLPLLQLEKCLLDCANEEEAVENLLESVLESVCSLIVLLNDGSGKEDKSEIKEPVLPPPESLSAQYASRSVFIISDVEEERLNPAYWLSIPVPEDSEQEPEQVVLDLISLAEKYISGEFDLKSSIENLCLSTESDADLKAKDKSAYGGKRKYQPGVNAASDGATKRPFIAPMRGRGFSRASSHSSRANDPFRSRPPNTSRPPSMHVDDFVALESHHNGSGGQSQAKRQESTRGRGRGFDRSQPFSSVRGGSGNSGRFFSPPGPYGRREIGNRVISGNGRGTTRISNSTWGNRTNSSVPKSPVGTGVRTNFSSRPSASERCNYSSPFVQPESRITSQRNRDPYPELNLPPSSVPISRFSRDVRIVGGLGAPVQGHWQETRNKAQNQRFMSSASPGRGSGRRDMTPRHLRSFTR